MGMLKFLVWTGCAVGLGIFLAKGDVGGRTPLEQMERTYKRNVSPSKVERLKDGIEDAFEDAKDAAQGAIGRKPASPRERISDDDRAAINRIIAQKK